MKQQIYDVERFINKCVIELSNTDLKDLFILITKVNLYIETKNKDVLDDLNESILRVKLTPLQKGTLKYEMIFMITAMYVLLKKSVDLNNLTE